MFDEATQKEICDLAKYWNAVEERVKEAELVRDSVVAPSIKELRYAGRWLVNVIDYAVEHKGNLDDPKVRRGLDERLFEVRLNVMQASHDAIDAMVHTIASTFKRIRSDVGAKTLIEHFPDYPDAVAKLEAIGSYIGLSRRERLRQNEIYEEFYKTDFKSLLDLMRRVNHSEAILRATIDAEEKNRNAVLDREKRVERRERHVLRWTIAGVVIALLVGGVFAPVLDAYLHWKWTKSESIQAPAPPSVAPPLNQPPKNN
jgi:hypothetical protein